MCEEREQSVSQTEFSVHHRNQRTVAPVAVEEHEFARSGGRDASSDVRNDRLHRECRQPDRSRTPRMFIALRVTERWKHPHVDLGLRRSLHCLTSYRFCNDQIRCQREMRSVLLDSSERLYENRSGRYSSFEFRCGEKGNVTVERHPLESTRGFSGTSWPETSQLRLPMTDRYDAIVIGAGHNGLIAAAYLARAGLVVAVFEARDSVGGCSSTVDFAGARVNICNCDHIAFRTTPVMEELSLHDLGLEYVEIDPSQINVPWDGRPAWPIFHSVDLTLEAIARTYPSQVDGYRRYCREALPVTRLVLEAAASGSRRLDLLGTVARARGSGSARLLKWSHMSAASVMREFFTDDNLIAPALATGPIVWGVSPELPGTGLGALTYAMRHVAGVGRPIGGSGQLSEALALRLRTSGGVIHTSSPVAGIVVEGELTRGVVLESGEEVRSNIVVSAVDPGRTFLKWIRNPPSGAGPTIERWRRREPQEGYESKIDALIERLPRYRQVDEDLFPSSSALSPTSSPPSLSAQGASTMITPSVSDLHQSSLTMARGEIARYPVMFANVPTVHDPSLLPTSSSSQKHVFSLETLFTPYRLQGGWSGTSEPRRWLELHDSLLEESVLADIGPWRAMTPIEYERDFHLPDGHATSFAGGPLAALRARPRELTRYRTPIGGLYLCGAATFPGAGIWGSSGRLCAREILGRV